MWWAHCWCATGWPPSVVFGISDAYPPWPEIYWNLEGKNVSDANLKTRCTGGAGVLLRNVMFQKDAVAYCLPIQYDAKLTYPRNRLYQKLQ